MTTTQKLNELVNYGGIWTPRHEVIADLVRTAKAAGAPNPQACADRWMQASDLRYHQR